MAEASCATIGFFSSFTLKDARVFTAGIPSACLCQSASRQAANAASGVAYQEALRQTESLTIRGQKMMYPPNAKKYSHSVEYDQRQVTSLESLTKDGLLLRSYNNSNPKAKGRKSDTKARLIFKIVCGQYY
uniref:Uncharacterized protein n=1 Tax=Eutreptiella gymnastica TaxID=73025 RepID=A0A6U7T779_9EUGL